MLTRGSREFPSHRSEDIPFAAKATDLQALRDAVVDAAGVGTGLWLSYLFVLFYFAIAAGAVTHRDLLLENPVKLPFLNVELPLRAFFILGPMVFLIVHAYVLLHFVLLAGKIGAFHSELEIQVSENDVQTRLRRQLPSNIFVQSLAGPCDVREGLIGFLLRLVIGISLVAAPIALLVLFQLQFLPYHSEGVTNWQRLAVVIDLVLLWILWPPIGRSKTAFLGWSDLKRGKVLAWAAVSTLPVLLVVTIATFPGEWLDENLPPVRLIPTTSEAWTAPSIEAIQRAGSGWATVHEELVAGHASYVPGEPQINFVTGKPKSLWPNVLILPNFEIGDRVKFNAEGQISIASDPVSLRGRALEGAVFQNAHLKKADFTGAQLSGANFYKADLREAKFGCDYDGVQTKCAHLQGANLNLAQLQGASLDEAQLQGASLAHSNLRGASLLAARLQMANLNGAQLQAASLLGAQLQGAWIVHAWAQFADLSVADLQAASFDGSQMQWASFTGAYLQGVSLQGAQLQHAGLVRAFIWRTDLPTIEAIEGALIVEPNPSAEYRGLDCKAKSCQWGKESFQSLRSLIQESASADDLQATALARVEILERPPGDVTNAKGWADLADASAPTAESYYQAMKENMIKVGCTGKDAQYLIHGMIRQLPYVFSNANRSHLAEIVDAFSHEANCPIAQQLSEDDKERLREMSDREAAAARARSARR